MKLEFNSLEEACEFAYEVRFKALLGAQSASKQVEKSSVTEKEEKNQILIWIVYIRF